MGGSGADDDGGSEGTLENAAPEPGPAAAPADAGDGATAEAAAPLTRAERLTMTGDALAEAAATLLDDGPATVPPGDLPAPGEALTFAEGCARLGVTPYILRRLMDDYEDTLPPLVEVGTERRLPPPALDILARIVRWRGEGLGREEILRRIRAGEAEPTADDDVQGQAVDRLVGELGRLHQELQRSEARRAEDRDRLLTTLMRTNQELQQLRYEMAAAKSRKERRKGFWARLFG